MAALRLLIAKGRGDRGARMWVPTAVAGGLGAIAGGVGSAVEENEIDEKEKVEKEMAEARKILAQGSKKLKKAKKAIRKQAGPVKGIASVLRGYLDPKYTAVPKKMPQWSPDLTPEKRAEVEANWRKANPSSMKKMPQWSPDLTPEKRAELEANWRKANPWRVGDIRPNRRRLAAAGLGVGAGLGAIPAALKGMHEEAVKPMPPDHLRRPKPVLPHHSWPKNQPDPKGKATPKELSKEGMEKRAALEDFIDAELHKRAEGCSRSKRKKGSRAHKRAKLAKKIKEPTMQKTAGAEKPKEQVIAKEGSLNEVIVPKRAYDLIDDAIEVMRKEAEEYINNRSA